MIRVTEKHKGLTDKENYIHCLSVNEFWENIAHNGYSWWYILQEIKSQIGDDNFLIYLNDDKIISETFDESTQTLTRVKEYDSMEQWEERKKVNNRIDYNSIIGEPLLDVETISYEEI